MNNTIMILILMLINNMYIATVYAETNLSYSVSFAHSTPFIQIQSYL